MALFGEFSKSSPRIGRNNTSIKYHDSRHSYLHGVISGNSVLGSPDRGSLSPGPGAYTGNIVEEPIKAVGKRSPHYTSSRRLSSPSFKQTVINGNILISASKRNRDAPGPGSYMDIYDVNSPWNKKSFNVLINSKNSKPNQKRSDNPTSNMLRTKSAPSMQDQKMNTDVSSASSYYLQLQEEQKKLQERQRKYYENHYTPKEPSTMASSSLKTPQKLNNIQLSNEDNSTTENIYSPRSPVPVKKSNTPSQSRFGKKTLKSRTLNRYR